MPYTPDEIAGLLAESQKWTDRCRDLTATTISRPYSSQRAREFGVHGLSRRLNMLEHCIDRVFESIPPDEASPSRVSLMDSTAFIHTFVINVYGAIDNLAHIWCAEWDIRDKRKRPLAPSRIGLKPDNEIVWMSLPADLQAYLAEHQQWFAYLENYRHALAHRIPLYIPPRQLGTADQHSFAAIEAQRGEAAAQGDWIRFDELGGMQDQLGSFEPNIMHSYGEAAQPVRFHAQLICDIATVVEIGENLFRQLDALADRRRECRVSQRPVQSD